MLSFFLGSSGHGSVHGGKKEDDNPPGTALPPITDLVYGWKGKDTEFPEDDVMSKYMEMRHQWSREGEPREM